MAASVCLPALHSGFSPPAFSHGRFVFNLRASTHAFSDFPFSGPPFAFIQRSKVRRRTSVPPSHFWVRASKGTTELVQEEGGEDFTILTTARSQYNEIVIVDTPQSRLLLLDSTHNIHSICNKGEKWTGFFWDEFVSLPAVIPQGPIAIFGLGGGTAAHLLLESWPHLHLEGWEIDGILVEKAREFLGLADVEKPNQDGGVLHVHVGDAFSPAAVVPGGFAGIVVDLFSDGKLLPQLQQVSTWLDLRKRLMPDGRIMVNCGGAYAARFNATIKALIRAFPGNLSWRKLSTAETENYLTLTGPMPDLSLWATLVPDRLSSNLHQWKPCEKKKRKRKQ
ncbi:hypothetical protein H6P81_008204 [Aristolochia fimbriata]|uniref:Uncharacterized protein n=1 Tax=Aristolochia fimbriata TaxID=158543 RepID=A0AAV7F2C8_ARIFI|nr:hypothetical protein H6P81_008204 [Aristolochia fimbriata]